MKLITYVTFSISVQLIFLCDKVASDKPTDINEEPEVITGLGKIRGKILTSRLGELFYAFRGIRYAKPPIGDLRFKAPEPIEQWNEVFDATQDGPMCPQPTLTGEHSDVSEDCLRLNVYTTEMDGSTTATKKPVIIYLHPGGFYEGSGQSKNNAGPEILMDRNIVLVTFNYRLASLGFMSTGTKECPGNAGFKDQVLVFKWVKLHIAKFGGDPNLVTLMGYSAGALSITLHMVSPMSRGLFHRAIVMSGSATTQYIIPRHQRELARRQARLLNCTDTSSDEIVACLKTKDAFDIGDSLLDMFEFRYDPILLWYPVIEFDFGQERFLTENPITMYRQGRFARIPVITGITQDEFANPAIQIINNESLRLEMNSNFTKLAPICFLYERDTVRSDQITQRLRKEYLNAPIENDRSLPGLNHLYSDSVIGFSVHRFARLVAPFVRVYYYKNSYVGRYSFTYYPGDKPFGTVHHDDLLYLLAVPSIAPMFKVDDPEHTHIEQITRLWASFAYKGDPNKPTDDVVKHIRWRQMLLSRMNYLDIDNEEMVMREGLFTDRYKIWMNLFPIDGRRRGKDGTDDDESSLLETLTDWFKDLIN